MATRPLDTSSAGWAAQRGVILGMDPSARVRAAIDLSESVRDIQIQGLLARNPNWTRLDAVRWLVQRQLS